MEIITTTVSVDAQKTADQAVIHLVQGDSGTRRLQFVPISAGQLIDMNALSVAHVKMRAVSVATEYPLLIDCTFNSAKREIFMTPTPSLVANADEFNCQLVLLDSSNQTLSSMPFKIIIHGTVYEGDVVEHTNTTVTNVAFDSDTKSLVLSLADGTQLTATLDHTHANATTSAAGFESAADKTNLDILVDRVNQDLRTNATVTPSFPNLNIGTAITINGTTGVVTGMRFT